MLRIDSDMSVLRDDQVERLVKPAIVSLSVEQVVSPMVQFRRVLRVVVCLLIVQNDNESRSFDIVQASLVDAASEVSTSRFGPIGTFSSCQ